MRKKITPETALKGVIKDYLKLSEWEYIWNLNYGIGVYRGVSDLTAFKKIKQVPITLWIEAKVRPRKQSPDQIDFQELIERNGGHYILAYDVDDIERYIVENFGEKSLLNYN